MALNIELILLVLALVSAQNTTDYDYETSPMNETSTESITELPKTTTMMATLSTVLPIQDNYWVSFRYILFIFIVVYV